MPDGVTFRPFSISFDGCTFWGAGGRALQSKRNTHRNTTTTTESAPARAITPEIASELSIAVLDHLKYQLFPKHGLDERNAAHVLDAMDAIVHDWYGAEAALLPVGVEDPTTLERLKKVHDRIKTYSDVYGIPVSELVAKALEEWMYVTGDLHLEILSGESGKVLPWPN